MERDARFAAYLTGVGERIRWKEARGSVLRELEGHLMDQADRLEAGGMIPEQAAEQAVLQMGDASEVGSRLDRVHRPRRDWVMLSALVFLCAIGLWLAADSSGLTPADTQGVLLRQLIFAAMGAVLLLAVTLFDYSRLRRFAPWLYVAGLLLPIAALLFGTQVNGAARLSLAGYTVDSVLPSCVLVLAGYSGLLQNVRGRGFRGLLRIAGLALPPIFLLMLIPRVAISLLLGLTLFVLLLDAVIQGHFGGRRSGQLTLLLLGGLGLPFGMFIASLPSFMRRLEIALNPWLDPEGQGYVATLMRRILSTARPIGLSESQGMYGATLAARLPGYSGDMALTYVIGQQGWLWGATALLAAGLLFWRLLRTALHGGGYGRDLSLSAGLFLSLELMAAAMTNLGLPLMGGLGFPFLSVGGTALLSNMALCGLVLSVRRRESLPVSPEPPGVGSAGGFGRWIRWEDGRLILTLRPPRG